MDFATFKNADWDDLLRRVETLAAQALPAPWEAMDDRDVDDHVYVCGPTVFYKDGPHAGEPSYSYVVCEMPEDQKGWAEGEAVATAEFIALMRHAGPAMQFRINQLTDLAQAVLRYVVRTSPDLKEVMGRLHEAGFIE